TLTELRAGGLVIGTDAFFTNRNEKLAALAPLSDTDNLSMARVRRSRTSSELRRQFCGFLPSGWRLHGPRSKGREASRPAGGAVEQVRTGHQSPDRPHSRPHRATDAARRRRRGD